MLNKRYANRLEAMLIAAVCILLVLLGRMAYLQLFKGDFYGEQADGNRLRRTKVTAPRGIFYDRDGVELVNNLRHAGGGNAQKAGRKQRQLRADAPEKQYYPGNADEAGGKETRTARRNDRNSAGAQLFV